MAKQLNLFTPKIEKRKPIYYNDLDINKKINYKANECGLHVVYKSFYHYYNRKLFQPITDNLTPKYLWHHKVNSGSENRLKDLFCNSQLNINYK